MAEVEWRAIPGYEGLYEVSSDGQIRGRSGHIRRQQMFRGYFRITLWKHSVPEPWFIARLVLTAFVGPQPSSIVAAHLNGNKQDNRKENLIWATQSENMSHRVMHGTDQIGERNPNVALTEEDVSKILEAREAGLTERAIGLRFGITRGHVHRIVCGKQWTHIFARRAAEVAAKLDRITTPDRCPGCNGTGHVADYVGLEMKPVQADCERCNGTGRLQ